MKILLKYLTSFISVTAFLAITSGVTIYTHYCNYSTILNHSLIASHSECNHEAEVSKCEMQDIQSCCKTDRHIAAKSNECCTDSTQFYKTSDIFNCPPHSNAEILKHVYEVITAFVNQDMELEDSYKEHVTTYSLPPPLSGKQIVVLYHQLKTDPDLSA